MSTNQGKQEMKSQKKKKQVKASKRSAQPTRKQSVNNNSFQKVVMKLGRETELYARSLACPMSGPLPTIPDYPQVLTKRARVWIKGQFATQANSLGFISFQPMAMRWNDEPNSAVIATDGSGAYTSFSNITAAGYLGYNSNSEFSISTYAGNQVLSRVVSACLRIQYIGTNLNEGGQVTGLSEPSHQDIVGFTSADLLKYDEGKRERITEKWYQVTYKPTDTIDTTFSGLTPAIGGLNGFFMGFACTSANGIQPFDFEAYACVEFIGKTVRGKMVSPSDAPGLSAVHTAALGNHITKMSVGPSEPRSNLHVSLAKQSLSANSGPGLLDTFTKAVSSIPSVEQLEKSASTASSVASGAVDLASWMGDFSGLF